VHGTLKPADTCIQNPDAGNGNKWNGEGDAHLIQYDSDTAE